MNQNNKHKESGRKLVDSGVEWVGGMPEGWNTERLKDVCQVNPSVSLPPNTKVSFIPMERLLFGQIDSSQEIEFDSIGSYTKFAEGDLLIAKVTPCFENGKIAIADGLKNGIGVGSSEIVPIRTTGVNSAYLMRIMQSPPLIAMGVATMNGTAGLQRVSTSFWKDTPIPLPPLPEQRAIASYLDHHVSLIDRERDLITKKIDLLKEKRRAMIYEVVTGKLRLGEGEDDVRMMDSGVEWIGDAPSHWETKRLGDLFRHTKNCSGGLLAPGALSFGEVVEKSTDKLPESTRGTYQDVFSGDYLLNPINLNYDLKSLRTGLSSIDVCVSPAYIVMKSKNGHSRYLKHLLYVFDVFRMKDLGAGVRQTISFSDIRKEAVFVPPLPEQESIASFLDMEDSLINHEIGLLTQKHDLLGEQRRALIFEAVTGKLDIGA